VIRNLNFYSKLWVVMALTIVAITSGCSKKSTDEKAKTEKAAESLSAEQVQAKLVTRGRIVYSSQCISCHNPDPKKDGSLGPNVAGSSRELLEQRVLHGKYPEGYQPKRPGQVMPKMPHLKNEIDALHAYLNSQ